MVTVNAVTSCDLGWRVAGQWITTGRRHSIVLPAVADPDTGRSYALTCRKGGSTITCRTTDHQLVEFASSVSVEDPEDDAPPPSRASGHGRSHSRTRHAAATA